MNTRERFLATMHFEKADRVMLWEMGYWQATLDRWYREGLKANNPPNQIQLNPGVGIRGEASPHDIYSTTRFRDKDVHEEMGFDEGVQIVPVNSGPQPPFEQKVLEETEEYILFQDEFGVQKRLKRKEASTPEFVGWPVENRKDFKRLVEERFKPDLKKRVPENWKEIVEKHKSRDYPLAIGGYPYGFYGLMRYMMGEERLLYNFYDNPNLVSDMMSFFADFWIELWGQALDEIDVDCAHFWEDMSYKNGPIISPAMFRQFMTPCYQRITGFLKERGVDIIVVDSDGNMDELIPLFLEAGLTGVFPIEARANNDLIDIRKRYPKMHILGGIDKIEVAKGPKAIDKELESKVPFMVMQGGYIPHLDHHVHPGISWDYFQYYRRRLKELVDRL